MLRSHSLMTAQPLLVAIVGVTGSGKTTLTETIADRLGRSRVSIVSQDSYYRDPGDLPVKARATLNYDVPEAFDRSLFLKHLRVLRSGLTIRVPVYSFESHARTDQTRPVGPREIILVDGLLLLFDPKIRGLFDLTIFVDAPTPVRLQRRMRRDIAERGRTASAVLTQFFNTVQPSHEAYVEPTKVFADLVLPNTGRLEECVEAAAGAILTRFSQRNRKRGERDVHPQWHRA